ncbi:GTP pyrophosphokinase [Pectobacterium brasiliense]|uniref:GTP pyrophosphokinase n=1 Tax=Pectobacterium brasiliense TaxID=180957 RepID=UPI0032ED597E
MSLIDSFILQYEKEYDYYAKVCRVAETQLDELLREAGIRAIVTSRAKSPSRLKDKLIQRNQEKQYKKEDDIYKDIVDLAGIRVALYFPDTNLEVDRIIKESFVLINEEIKFPKVGAVRKTGSRTSRFPGYVAVHYRVRLKEHLLERAIYHNANIEIQVASVLMHAWSEVEHDLVYKPLSGHLSDEEYAILDEINGLVLSGEIALERLKHAGVTRTAEGNKSYRNQYELAASMIDIYRSLTKDSSTDTHDFSNIGRVNILFDILQQINLNNPEQIKKLLVKILPNITPEVPIVESILSEILDEHSNVISIISKESDSLRYRLNNKKLFGNDFAILFFKKYESLTELLKERTIDIHNPNTTRRGREFKNDLPEGFMDHFSLIRKVRNRIAHGQGEISDETIFAYEKLDEMLKWFKNKKAS